MDLSLLLLVAILVLDVAISIWNAYAAGLTLTLLRGAPRARLSRAAAVAGLLLGYVGMAYVTTIAFGWVATWIGYLSLDAFVYLLAFDFLVFGALIIGLGLVVTAQSVAVAYQRRDWRSIAVAAWNVFAEVWDIAIYADGFRAAFDTMKGGERDRSSIILVVVLAMLVAFFVTYAAYRHGVRRAEGYSSAATPDVSGAAPS